MWIIPLIVFCILCFLVIIIIYSFINSTFFVKIFLNNLSWCNFQKFLGRYKWGKLFLPIPYPSNISSVIGCDWDSSSQQYTFFVILKWEIAILQDLYNVHYEIEITNPDGYVNTSPAQISEHSNTSGSCKITLSSSGNYIFRIRFLHSSSQWTPPYSLEFHLPSLLFLIRLCPEKLNKVTANTFISALETLSTISISPGSSTGINWDKVFLSPNNEQKSLISYEQTRDKAFGTILSLFQQEIFRFELLKSLNLFQNLINIYQQPDNSIQLPHVITCLSILELWLQYQPTPDSKEIWKTASHYCQDNEIAVRILLKCFHLFYEILNSSDKNSLLFHLTQLLLFTKSPLVQSDTIVIKTILQPFSEVKE